MTDTPLKKKAKILLIDDDPFFINMYSIKFKPPEFELSSLKNADGDFVNIVVGILPDLILIDLDFPGCARNGAEAAKALQFDERTKSIPIFFLTNAADTSQVRLAQHVPTAGFLKKASLTPSQVVMRVRAFLGKQLTQ